MTDLSKTESSCGWAQCLLVDHESDRHVWCSGPWPETAEQRVEAITRSVDAGLVGPAWKGELRASRRKILREIADEMAVEQDDERLGYVTVQVNRETWAELKEAQS